MRLVAFPIGALVVVVSTEKGVETLRRVQHVVVGAAGPLIVLVIFARRAELREFGVEFVIGLSRTRRRGAVRGVERQARHARKRRTHHRHRSEYIRPDERAPRRDRRAGIVPDHGRDLAIAEREHKPHGIADHVEDAEGIGIGIIGVVPAGGAAIAALIRGDRVISRRCKRQHYLAPAVGEFRKAMQQQHGGPAGALVASFQNVHRQAINVSDGA
jgi:hypothetical protein